MAVLNGVGFRAEQGLPIPSISRRDCSSSVSYPYLGSFVVVYLGQSDWSSVPRDTNSIQFFCFRWHTVPILHIPYLCCLDALILKECFGKGVFLAWQIWPCREYRHLGMVVYRTVLLLFPLSSSICSQRNKLRHMYSCWVHPVFCHLLGGIREV